MLPLGKNLKSLYAIACPLTCLINNSHRKIIPRQPYQGYTRVTNRQVRKLKKMHGFRIMSNTQLMQLNEKMWLPILRTPHRYPINLAHIHFLKYPIFVLLGPPSPSTKLYFLTAHTFAGCSTYQVVVAHPAKNC